MYEVAAELNLEHNNKACETEHEDNCEVDELIFGKFYDIKEHTNFGYIFLDEVHELKYNKGCCKALAISVGQELSANLIQNVVLTGLNQVDRWSSLRCIWTHDLIQIILDTRIISQNVNIECTSEYLRVMVNDLHPVDGRVERQADDETIENVPGVLEMLDKTSNYQLYEVDQFLSPLLSFEFRLLDLFFLLIFFSNINSSLNVRQLLFIFLVFFQSFVSLVFFSSLTFDSLFVLVYQFLLRFL